MSPTPSTGPLGPVLQSALTIAHVAGDVVREAFARRFMIAVGIFISVGLLGLTVALDLEVVEGALAAGRLFGMKLDNAIIPVDVALRPIFQALAYTVFYLGLLFGIVATADIATKMLAPGRVELLLSLPVRRAELVVGTYLGVLTIAAIGTSFAIGGVSAILFFKAEFVTAAPVVGALCAVLGFMAIYAVMLCVTTLARSAALAAGAGLMTYIAGIITSDRESFAGYFRSGAMRTVVEYLVAPLPRMRALADLGGAAAGGEATDWGAAVPLVLATVAFAAALVAAAAYVVSGRDY